MRILLVQPPLVPSGPVEPPVGLVALAAWLVQNGHEPRLLDLDLFQRLCGTAEAESGTREFSLRFTEFDPEVVGVTSMYSNSLHAARLIAQAKKLKPEVTTIAGGSHFGALARESLMRHPSLDFVIEGEGERALIAFLDQLGCDRDWEKVPSLTYRTGETIVSNPAAKLIDLRELPNPWEKLGNVLDIEAYLATLEKNATHRVAYVEAGRGCPYHCSFCATAPFWKRAYRVKPAEAIVEEIRFLQKFGYDRFVLIHDLLTVNRKFVSELCDKLLESRLPIEWMANSRTDIRLDGILPKMKAAGCWKLFFGIESASDHVQNSAKKYLDLPGATNTVQTLADHGITSTCSFVIGFPDEERSEVSASIGLGARMKLLGAETVQFHRLRIWPPAELSTLGLDQEFDRESLEIEYPFLDVPAVDLEEIRRSPDFFGGYFVPKTSAGTRLQIANLEMFTQHAVSIAPMTVYALERFLGGSFVDCFYSVLARSGPLSRKALDWEGGRLWENWLAIRPYLVGIAGILEFSDPSERRAIIDGLLAYEEHRVEFTTGAKSLHKEDEFNSAKISSEVDIAEVIRRIKEGRDLDASVLRQGSIIFRRDPSGTFRSFQSEASL